MTAFESGALFVALAASVADVRSRRIPNALTASAIALGVVAHVVLPSGDGLGAALLGGLLGLAVFLPFFALGGVGGGDVKLMAALGVWVGAVLIGWSALYGAVAGGLLALCLGAARGYLRQAFANIGALLLIWSVQGVRPVPALTLERGDGPRLPYALPVFAGLVTALWRH